MDPEKYGTKMDSTDDTSLNNVGGTTFTLFFDMTYWFNWKICHDMTAPSVKSNAVDQLEDGNHDEELKLSEATEAAIKDMCYTEFCRPDQELTAQINELFPTEQSLAQLDTVIAAVEAEMHDLDVELASLVESHEEVGAQGEAALEEAQRAMVELEQRIDSIRGKTRSSDEIVREMTRDIKQLDIAKRNLTSSITTLHHLHILLTGVDSLAVWVEQRDYASIARQLPAILNVLQLFDDFQEVEQMAKITNRLNKLKQSLTIQLAAVWVEQRDYASIARQLPAILNVLQLFDDFQEVEQMAKITNRLNKLKQSLTIQLAGDMKAVFQAGQLSERVTDMCRVAAALEGTVKANFCKWFIDQQLAEYTVLYAENEEGAWLDKIEERYKWYVRKLTDFERTGLAKVFPPDWDMGRLMTKEFCNVTRDVLYRMLTRRRPDLDFRLLGHAIQHTRMFEALLTKRFPPKAEFNFDKAIWSVFDSFLDVFISAQEKTLNEFLESCAIKIRSGNTTEVPSRECSTHAVPFSSSADMFLLLKKVITECSKLSSEPDALLNDVVGVVRVCLRNYAHGCLTAFLPTAHGQQSSSSTANLFNLIREDTTVLRFFATILQGVDLSQEMETFYTITNQALAVLVQDLEGACDAALQAIAKITWSAVDGVGDESPFVGAIRSHLRAAVPRLRDLLSDRRKYFAHLCLKLATQLSHKFVGALFRCKPISTHGAEQLLLDTHSLKSFLLQMPSIDSAIAAKPPTAYVNGVSAALNKAEMILKVVMSNMETPEDFVEHYSTLLPESNTSELQKVLDMRGVKKVEQTAILQAYRLKFGAAADATPTVPVGVGNSLSATQALNAVVSMAADGLAETTSMKRLEKLVKRNF
ncbi:Vps53-like protein [Necator americanus]|uniref:Vacuolar protein sorting-associated protein 53 homolog n=1 Tax=Necator americanus TaxID=51031 RepID=W2TFU0_NECAM|nr:Vps53-like protein [Necator americanus]ETN79872.1 Vps53-like protein [Necator americanus]